MASQQAYMWVRLGWGGEEDFSHWAVPEEYLEALAGTKWSGTGSYVYSKICTYYTSALRVALAVNLLLS